MIVDHAQHRRFKRELAALTPGRKPRMNPAKMPVHQPVAVFVVRCFARGKKLAKCFLLFFTRIPVGLPVKFLECFAHGIKVSKGLTVCYGVLY